MSNDQWNPFIKPTPQFTEDDFEQVACPKCGNAAFDQYYKLFKLSALKSPTGKTQIYNVPIFVCVACNYILDPKKEETFEKKLDEK